MKDHDCCKGHEHEEDNCCGGHGHEHEHHHEHHHEHAGLQDIVFNNDILINTLISLLMDKKVITEEEFVKALDKIQESINQEGDSEEKEE